MTSSAFFYGNPDCFKFRDWSQCHSVTCVSFRFSPSNMEQEQEQAQLEDILGTIAADLAKLMTAMFGTQFVDGVQFEKVGDEMFAVKTTVPGFDDLWIHFNITDIEAFVNQHWIADKSGESVTWEPRSDPTSAQSSDADWPMMTAAFLEGIMWREKKPVGQEGAWHRPRILALNAASREDPECRLAIYPATQYEIRFDLGDEKYQQLMFGTVGWTKQQSRGDLVP